MTPHCTSPSFLESLSGFVASLCADEDRRRRRDYRERELLSAIDYREREILRLESIPGRRQRSAQIENLRYQVRHAELTLAFLDFEAP